MEKTVAITLEEYLHLVEFKKNIKEGKCVVVINGYLGRNPDLVGNIIFYNVNEAIEEIAEINKHIVTNYNQSELREKLENTEIRLYKTEIRLEKLKYENKELKEEIEHQKNKNLFERIFNK